MVPERLPVPVAPSSYTAIVVVAADIAGSVGTSLEEPRQSGRVASFCHTV